MKKVITAVLAGMLLLPSLAFANETTPAAPTLESTAGLVMNATTGEVLFEKNADQALPPASITKVMTLTLAAEALEKGTIKLTDKVLVSEKAWKTGGSRMFLEVGREVTVEDLLKGIAVDSGNDACVALAEFIAGSTDAFVKLMNEEAKKLGMSHTTFGTVNGLPEKGGVADMTTARDIATLSAYYVNKYPKMLSYNSLKEFDFDVGRGQRIKQYNHNPLITNDYPGADGLKTGYISEHFNIVGTAQRNGLRIVAVTLKAATEGQRYRDIKGLLDYGFASYTVLTKGTKGEEIQELRVYKATTKHANVVLANDIHVTIKAGAEGNVTEKVELPDHISGAKKAGTEIGKKMILIDGKVVSETPIILKDDLVKAKFMQRFFDSIAMGFNKITSFL